MSIFDVSEATLMTRFLAALITLLILAGAAAVVVVFSMMMVLFAADSGQAHGGESSNLGIAVVGVSLGIAVLVPPVLLMMRFPTSYCFLPAGVGFVLAGVTTLWIIMATLASS